MPYQGGDDEKQRHAQHHIDSLEPGHGTAPLTIAHQPGNQLIEAKCQFPAMTLHNQT
ncbi:hypothetical protein O23A_p2803 [Aeromonas salmonicida]|nr:hypothetical protein O23A_p2803 [Aeromonas salmonicida]